MVDLMDMKEITKKVCSVAMASSFLAACGAPDGPEPPLRRMEVDRPDWAYSVTMHSESRFGTQISVGGHQMRIATAATTQDIGGGLTADYGKYSGLKISDRTNVECSWDDGRFEYCSVENPAYTKFMENKKRPYLVYGGQPMAPKR